VAVLKGIPVLIVEDDPSTRLMLESALGGFGAAVLTASSPQEAMRVLADRRCVVISDIAMPDEDGYTFIARLRIAERGSHRRPAIALTANARTEDRDRALSAGFDSFLAKPVDVHELAGEIERLAKEMVLP
jgi:CheY-like chemotaxis protein